MKMGTQTRAMLVIVKIVLVRASVMPRAILLSANALMSRVHSCRIR